jgi:hypothetical protein
MVQLSIPTAASRHRSGLIEWTVPEQGQSHNSTVLADWFHLHLLGLDGSDKAILDGCSLTIPAVTAVARYVFHSVPKIVNLKTSAPLRYHFVCSKFLIKNYAFRYNAVASIDTHPSVVEQVNNSVAFLHRQLEEGNSIYGEINCFYHIRNWLTSFKVSPLDLVAVLTRGPTQQPLFNVDCFRCSYPQLSNQSAEPLCQTKFTPLQCRKHGFGVQC